MGALVALAAARLVKYDAMCAAIERARTLDEVREIRDRAVALRAYKRIAMDETALRQVAEIKARAERRAGEMLREMAARGERQTKVSGRGDTLPQPKLKDLGISRDQSSDWQKIAAIPEKKFERHLAATAQQLGAITTGRLLHAVRQEAVDANRASRGAAPLPAGQYDVLLADPPWRYSHAISGHGAAEDHYPTMPVEEICALKVGTLAAPNATLFLWVTNPFLAEGLAVAAAWVAGSSATSSGWRTARPAVARDCRGCRR